MTNANRMLSRSAASSAGSASSGMTRASGIGVIHRCSGDTSASEATSGGRDGPSSIGRARRCRPRSMSRQTLVAIRYSHDLTLDRPSNRSAARQARTIASCTASSASNADPSIR